LGIGIGLEALGEEEDSQHRIQVRLRHLVCGLGVRVEGLRLKVEGVRLRVEG